MAELDIPVGDILRFAISKRRGICQVKFCHNDSDGGRKLCHKHRMMVWRKRNPTRAAYHALKSHARHRKHVFTITFEEFAELCEATGYVGKKGNAADALHIDRINPKRGYESDNIRVITCAENARKGSYERRIQLRSGKWVTLWEIGVGVPASDYISEEEDWVDPDTLCACGCVIEDEPF